MTQNGLIIQDGIAISVKNNKNDTFQKYFFSILNALLGITATLFLFIDFFAVPVNLFLMFAVICLCVSVFSAIFIIKKFAYLAFIPIALGIFLYVRFKSAALITGITQLIDCIYDSARKTDLLTPVFVLMIILLSFLIVFFTVYRPNFFCDLFCTLWALVVGIANGFMPDYVLTLLLLLHLISTYAMQIASYYDHSDVHESNFVRAGNSFFAKPNFKFNVIGKSALTVSIITLTAVLLTGIFVHSSLYKRPEKVKILHNNLISSTEMFDQNNLSWSLNNYVNAFKYALQGKGLPSPEFKGFTKDERLGQDGSIQQDEQEIVKITSTYFSQTLYLKNWVGVDYNGSSFKALDERIYETYQDYINVGGIYPQDYYEKYLKSLESTTELSEDKMLLQGSGRNIWVDLNVDFLVNGNKESYVPDFAYADDENLTKINDTGYEISTPNSYHLKFLDYNGEYYADKISSKKYDDYSRSRMFMSPMPDSNGEFIIENENSYIGYNSVLSSYNPLLSSVVTPVVNLTLEDYAERTRNLYNANITYRRFVHNYYLQLPDTPAMDRIREKSGIDNVAKDDIMVSETGMVFNEYPTNIYQRLYEIREIIQKDTYYSLDAGVTPSNEDFVEYFLFNQKKGSCSYYAATGVILCRMAGIPARYCTGIVAFPTDWANSTDTSFIEGREYRSFNLSAMRGHAWVEVYVDGHGWIPFEFTAGYDSGEVYAENPPPPPDFVETDAPTSGTGAAVSRSTVSGSKTTATTSQTTKSVTTKVTTLPTENNDFHISKTLLITLILIAASIILPFVLIMLNRAKNKNKYAPGNNVRNNILIYYSYILDLLSFAGFRNNNEYYTEFAAAITDYDIKNVTQLALKAEFSNLEISENDCSLTLNTAHDILQKILTKQNIFGKFELWIKGLL